MTNPRGRFGIGVNQGSGPGDDYPIVRPSVDITELLADAYLSYTDDINAFALPFHIKYLHGFGTDIVGVPITPVHTHDVEIVDANNVTVFDSLIATDFKSEVWDNRLLILEWTDANRQILRTVHHTEWSPEDEARTYDIYIEPTAGVLDARAIYQIPKRVTSIRVGFITLKPNADGDLGNIILQNGFNTVLTASDSVVTDGSRRTTDITINADPNSGKGRFGPGCSEVITTGIRRINTIGGDNRGNFLLDATGCYRVERPVISVLQEDPRQVRIRDHTLQIFNDCGPCCDCDDFIAVWEAIRRLRDRYADLIARVQAARDTYHANRDRWNESKDCREADQLRLILQSACPGELGVAAGFCNNSEDCIEGLVIHISFDFTDGTGDCNDAADSGPLTAVSTPTLGQLLCSSVFRQGNVEATASPPKRISNEFYVLGGAYPHFYAIWDKVDPGTMASVTFRLQFINTTTADSVEAVADAFEVGPNITINPDGSPVPGFKPGEGPLTTPESMHLVECPLHRGATMIPECCEESII